MATVKGMLGAGTQVELTARQFRWSGDEPLAAGGTDTAPTPYELLLGSLAACITLTLRLYANHKGIALRGVDVDLEYDRVHADDCAECDESESGTLDRVRTRVTIHGDFDEAQRRRLAQVAERCPVHKTLARGIKIFDAVEFTDA